MDGDEDIDELKKKVTAMLTGPNMVAALSGTGLFPPFKFIPGNFGFGLTESPKMEEDYWPDVPDPNELTCRGGPLGGEHIVTPAEIKDTGRDYFFVVRQSTEPSTFIGAVGLSKPKIKYLVQRARYQMKKDISGFFIWDFEGWRDVGWFDEIPDIFGMEQIAKHPEAPWGFSWKTAVKT